MSVLLYSSHVVFFFEGVDYVTWSVFYGISTFVGYSMLNLVYIYDFEANTFYVTLSFNELLKLIHLHTVKKLQVFLFNMKE